MNLEQWLQDRKAGKHTPLNLPPEMQDLHGLTLEEAIQAHEAWIKKLETTLCGQNPEEYDPGIVGADHLCKVGKWIYGPGQQAFSSLPEFASVVSTHAKFHKTAGRILDEHKHGHFAEAIKMLRQDLVQLSFDFQTDIIHLLLGARNAGYKPA